MKKMSFYELRERIKAHKKFPLVRRLDKSSVVNHAYPGQFNLSFTESKWLDKFGNYLDVNEDFFFTTIQPVIRHNDLVNQILAPTKKHNHLALFDMADLFGAGVLIDKDLGNEFTNTEIAALTKFFIDLGISLEKIYVSNFAGATVREATNGKYGFDTYIPPFEFGANQWIKNGIPATNIIPDKTRDTFLALNIYGRPTPWGYRNEIYIKTERKRGQAQLITAQTIIKVREACIKAANGRGFTPLSHQYSPLMHAKQNFSKRTVYMSLHHALSALEYRH